ncbi:hypothetical protein CAter282_3421 [Collimonas arenae]|uniref:Uncharacterized protein n=1 Tax=Collimonas arenae TaxID=279058 RepID=A0A127QM35_9BURK|nr:hypothetical protein CAter10_3748 [Collimonas arenae]AMP11110.1 hypothetical protein CAter282_3421 [Collimonas arenae]
MNHVFIPSTATSPFTARVGDCIFEQQWNCQKAELGVLGSAVASPGAGYLVGDFFTFR